MHAFWYRYCIYISARTEIARLPYPLTELGSICGFWSRHEMVKRHFVRRSRRMRVLRLRVHTCLRKGIWALRNKYRTSLSATTVLCNKMRSVYTVHVIPRLLRLCSFFFSLAPSFWFFFCVCKSTYEKDDVSRANVDDGSAEFKGRAVFYPLTEHRFD